MSPLFEYGNWEHVRNMQELEEHLLAIWQDQLSDKPDDESKQDSAYQPFLSIRGNQVKANNYIGFIQNEEEVIELYPKVFKHLVNPDKNLMLQHIFYWFSYCRRWRFPFTQTNLGNREVDSFPELITYLIACQFKETVSTHPFMQYHAVGETLSSPKGSINFARYINNGLSTGNHHLLECDHEPFLYDNLVNRIVKYCTRLLLGQTRYFENQRMLQEVLFVLDEVEDRPVTIHDVNAVKLNPFYENYHLLMEISKTIINAHLYSNGAFDSSKWCLLFPMEYVFEDFVAGFLEKHFSDKWHVHYQKSDKYLVTSPKEVFQLQHDIFLTSRGSTNRQIIIDTKYKLRTYSEDDPKKGVLQNDLYQVVSYAYRRGCSDVILIYPNLSEDIKTVHSFMVPSGFGKEAICIRIVEIPFWSMESFSSLTESLKATFTELLD